MIKVKNKFYVGDRVLEDIKISCGGRDNKFFFEPVDRNIDNISVYFKYDMD